MFSCCLTEDQNEQRRIDKEIERKLKQERNQERKEIKLLFLGAGESGKSTFIKQMRIIHGKGYSEEERLSFVDLIRQNVLKSLNMILESQDVAYCESRNSILANFVTGRDNLRDLCNKSRDINEENASFDEGEYFLEATRSIWKDQGVQEAFRTTPGLPDSASYYLRDLERIFTRGYLPTVQDILRVRIPTTGILEHRFEVDRTTFRMIDVSGQRGERRKWINCMDRVTSVVFLAALSEYDQVVEEAQDVNRLQESMALFATIAGCNSLISKSVLLFLNKKDLLEEKVTKSNLRDFFPGYKGPCGDALAAREFILEAFRKIFVVVKSRKGDGDSRMYSHFTCATDTDNVKFVFAAVRDVILLLHMKAMSLI